MAFPSNLAKVITCYNYLHEYKQLAEFGDYAIKASEY